LRQRGASAAQVAGATYEGFGTIGGLYESPGAAFCEPTEADQPLSFSVDITMSSFFFGEPGALQLWGGIDSCSLDELLWTSPVIDNVDSWQTYCGTMLPTKSFSHLTLVYAPGATAGYILVDNFKPATSCD
jgi:hypothetical protein